MAICHIALGGNVGDVVATMDAALERIDSDATSVVAVSNVYETTPVGVAAGGPFLNAAATLRTTAAPLDLLQRLKNIEHELGRTPTDRWSARRIDLDLLLWEAEIIDDARLSIPHPHLWYRRFVLDPLCDVAAIIVHPVIGETIGELRRRLQDRPLTVAVIGGCAEDRLAIGSLLRSADVEVRPMHSNDGPLRIVFLDEDQAEEPGPRVINLNSLPGSFLDAARSILTAALDEPRLHSRPLRRMP